MFILPFDAAKLLDDNVEEFANNIKMYGNMAIINFVDKGKISDQQLDDFLNRILEGITIRDEFISSYVEDAVTDIICGYPIEDEYC